MGVRRKAFNYVNDLRLARGREPLEWDRRLNRATRKHSRRMARRGSIYHTQGGRIARTLDRRLPEGSWELAGENVGQSGSFGLERLLDAFRKSDAHRRNMLRPRYSDMNVGVARDEDGELYLTYWFYG